MEIARNPQDRLNEKGFDSSHLTDDWFMSELKRKRVLGWPSDVVDPVYSLSRRSFAFFVRYAPEYVVSRLKPHRLYIAKLEVLCKARVLLSLPARV